MSPTTDAQVQGRYVPRVRATLTALLQCPRCAGELNWQVGAHDGDRLAEAEARCGGCSAVYPVRGGVGLFRIPEERPPDPWGQSRSGLLTYLEQNPEVERALIEDPIDSLAPADQYFRSYVLRLRGRWRESIAARRIADQGVYTEAYRAGSERMIDALLSRARERLGVVIDLASGEGMLASRLARSGLDVVVTDASPSVLASARSRMQADGGEVAGAVALDARRTPFRSGAIKTLTTFAGLGNIGLSSALASELRRIVGGVLLSVELFFDTTDQQHVDAARNAGLPFHGRDEWLSTLTAAGFDVRVAVAEPLQLVPTPTGVLIAGAVIDGLPATATRGEWALLEAR